MKTTVFGWGISREYSVIPIIINTKDKIDYIHLNYYSTRRNIRNHSYNLDTIIL